jgi:hypothetical protein
MKKVLFMVVLALMVGTTYAQSVKRQGNVFIEQKDTAFVNNGIKTKYTYKAKDGKEYPIFLSKNGKAYIVRVSKKSGKQYKQYLPKVTEQLNTSAK